MPVTAHSTLGSEIQVEISSTLTKVPGVQNFKLNPGENGMIEKGDLTSDYAEVQGTGVQSGGNITGQLVWNPLDATHQFCHARKNDGADITGNVKLGLTGEEYATTMVCTKWEIDAPFNGGYMVDFEFQLTDRVTLNES